MRRRKKIVHGKDKVYISLNMNMYDRLQLQIKSAI